MLLLRCLLGLQPLLQHRVRHGCCGRAACACERCLLGRTWRALAPAALHLEMHSQLNHAFCRSRTSVLSLSAARPDPSMHKLGLTQASSSPLSRCERGKNLWSSSEPTLLSADTRAPSYSSLFFAPKHYGNVLCQHVMPRQNTLSASAPNQRARGGGTSSFLRVHSLLLCAAAKSPDGQVQ